MPARNFTCVIGAFHVAYDNFVKVLSSLQHLLKILVCIVCVDYNRYFVFCFHFYDIRYV